MVYTWSRCYLWGWILIAQGCIAQFFFLYLHFRKGVSILEWAEVDAVANRFLGTWIINAGETPREDISDTESRTKRRWSEEIVVTTFVALLEGVSRVRDDICGGILGARVIGRFVRCGKKVFSKTRLSRMGKTRKIRSYKIGICIPYSCNDLVRRVSRYPWQREMYTLESLFATMVRSSGFHAALVLEAGTTRLSLSDEQLQAA